jgi:hypothetical protein
MRDTVTVLLAAVVLAAAGAPAGPRDDRSLVAERVERLTRNSAWVHVRDIRLGFRTFHPQGLVKIGEILFVSSVEVRVPPARLAAPAGGFDRDTGEGVGHLFKVSMTGELLGEVVLGAGPVYHPGGIDYDGESIWVPVSEYRPDSHAIVYRVEPGTMRATEILRVDDHVGAIVHDTDDNSLHGVSWGSRRSYRWPLDALGRATGAGTTPLPAASLNPSHYIDYQDCAYAGHHRMLCTGLAEFRSSPGAPPFRLGGMDLVNLVDGRPIHQVPVPLWTSRGLDMTHNPVWIEPTAAGLRAYFLPEDETSTLYVYDVAVN